MVVTGAPRPSVIDQIHDQWRRDNGYSGEPQAPSKPQAASKASSTDSQEAPSSKSQA